MIFIKHKQEIKIS